MFTSFLRRTLSASVRVVAFPRTLVQHSKTVLRLLPHLAALTALAAGLATSAGAQNIERASRYSGNALSRHVADQRAVPRAFAPAEQGATASNRLDLGSVGAGKTSPEGEVTFTFTRSATLGSIDVLAAGAPTGEFANTGTGTCAIGHTYAAGDTCTVRLTLTPKSSGLRSGAVVLKDAAQTLIASALAEGSGSRAQVIFFPGTLSTAITGVAFDQAIAVDGNGNLYYNSGVAFAGPLPPGVNANGDFVLIKQTLQSNGTYTPSYLHDFGGSSVNFGGIALDAAGNVYVPDSVVGNGGIYKFTAASSYAMSYILGGSFVSSNDVAFDSSGNMYIADFGDDASTTSTPDNTGGLYKSVFNGSTFGAPSRVLAGECVSVAVDGSGNVYASFVTSQAAGGVPTASAIYKWPPSLGSQTTVDSSFVNVVGITVDPAGNLYVADDNSEDEGPGTPGIFMETPNGASYTKSAVALAAGISFPTATEILPEAIAIDGDGNLFSAVNTPQESNNHEEIFELNYATPPSLAFGSEEVGNLSSPQSVQIKNIGNLGLTISTPVSGTNPSPSAGYVVTGGTCPLVTPSEGAGTLASNASCTYQVAFDPTVAGSESGSVTITDNEQVASTQSIPTTGTGLATHFVLSSYATTQSAGVSFTIVVTAQNAGNTTDTTFADAVHFTSSDGSAVLPVNAFLTGGTGTFTFTLNTPGTQTITVTDTAATTLTATTSNINVTAATATHFQLAAPASATAGASFSITLTALTAASATATGYLGTVHFTSTDPSATLPANYTFVAGDNGVHTFSGTILNTGGIQTITATDTVTGSITGTSSGIAVNVGPAITLNPVSVSVTAGATATFTAAASGTPTPTVQWQVSTNGGATFSNISGATSATLSFAAAAGQNGNEYRAVFTNSVGSATTTAATLTVNSAPVITANPVSESVNAGATATFTAAASGTPTPTVQWQVSTDGGATFNNISGATSTTLSFVSSAGQNGAEYRAVFTNSAGSATTTAATLTVTVGPVITLNPVSVSVTAGATATFTAAASGTPTPTVQWQVSTDGGATFNNISGATSTTLSFVSSAGQNGAEYRAVFTNSAGSATTTAATLTVNSAPVIITNPVSESVNAGATATFTAAASGTPTPTVQWQVSTDGGATFSNISGATSTTLSFVTAAGQNGAEYRAVFTNTAGSATTAAATLTVNSAPVIITNPVSESVNAGATATFTAAASGTPAPTVQWQVSTDGGATFSNISGATSTTLSFVSSAGQNGAEYRAVFTNSAGSATTTAATLTVNSAPVITSNPVSETVSAGSMATFTAAASGTPTPTVQWQVSTDGGATFNSITGATSTTLSFVAAAGQNGNEYRAVFINSVGSATTTAATLTVTSGPVITLNPVSESVSAGATATFTAAASGNPTPTAQWQVSTNGGATFSNIAGATSTTLSFVAASGQNGNLYRAVFTNATGSATTTAATLTVSSGPSVTTNPVSESVPYHSTVTFTAAATGSPAPTVQWQKSTNGGATFSNISGATSTSLVLSGVTVSMSGNMFRAVFTNSVGSATTTAATLTVTPIAPIITWANPADILFGSALGTGQLNAKANVPGTFSYSPAAGTVLPVGNGQTLSVTFTPTDSVDYTQATKSVLINVLPTTCPTANLVVTSVLTREAGGSIQVTVTVANAGGSAASKVVITGATLGGAPSPAVPVALGSIPANGTAKAVLVFPNVGATGSRAVLTVSGTYKGGAFGDRLRVTLP